MASISAPMAGRGDPCRPAPVASDQMDRRASDGTRHVADASAELLDKVFGR
jgi:hypothetical protein